MNRVVVVGSFNVDHVWRVPALPQAGATLSGDYTTGPGGKGFNQAVAARRAGAGTCFVCALGDDLGGAAGARSCARPTASTCATWSCSAPTGTAGIYVDAQGRNSIVIGAGANAALQPAFVAEALAGLQPGDVLVAQLESPLDAVAKALDAGRAAGATTLLNPAPANVAIDHAMLERADILTPNETEFAAMLGRHVGARVEADAVSGIDQQRLHALCRDLTHGTVVVTLGAVGCFVSHADENLRGDASCLLPRARGSGARGRHHRRRRCLQRRWPRRWR
jgi:ribokinase